MRVLRAALLAIGAAFLLAYIVVAVLRLRTPFELEWMEGGVVDHVRRVMAGHQLYQRPSVEFTPYMYTPLYYYVSAGAAWVLGVGYFPLRLVSFLSSLVVFATIGYLVTRETGDRWAGAVAACLFAACFRIGGAWFDLARVDSLFMAFLLLSLVVARYARSNRAVVLAGALATSAFLTKQAALLPIVAVLPYLWHRNRRQAGVYAVALVVGVGGSIAALNLSSDGWFSKYVFELPAGHSLVPAIYETFWTVDMARLVLAVIVGIVGLAAARRRHRSTGASPLWFHLPVAAALLAAAYTARLHSGGYDNVLFPGYAAVAILFGLGLHALTTPPPVGETPAGREAEAHRPGRGRRRVAAIACTAGLLQFATLIYNPAKQVPSAADAGRAHHLIAELGQLQGSIYLPGHGWYLSRAGKETSAQGAAIADILRGRVGSTRRSLASQLRRTIAGQRFDAIVVDSDAAYSYLPRNFQQYYRRDHALSSRAHVLLPRTGSQTGPLTVWLPRR